MIRHPGSYDSPDDLLADVQGVGKVYAKRRVLDGVDLTIRRGEVLGLVGPNGAGKSTLIRILSAMARPTEGEGVVLGRSIRSSSSMTPFLGMMIERPTFIEALSGRSNLSLLFGIRGDSRSAVVAAALTKVGLDPEDRRPVRTYSLGMRQRLSLAQAIGESPSLLVLDEPTNGLDPSGIIAMHTLIRRLADEGMGVLLASHLLGEVEAVCDRVMLLKEGRVIRTLRPFQDDLAPFVLLEVERESDLALVSSMSGVRVCRRLGPLLLRLELTEGVPATVRALAAAGVGIEAVYRDRDSLERVYLQEVANS